MWIDICDVICHKFLGGCIGTHIHVHIMKCCFQVYQYSLKIQYTRSSSQSRFFQFQQVPIFVTEFIIHILGIGSLWKLLDMSGGFIGKVCGVSQPLCVGGTL